MQITTIESSQTETGSGKDILKVTMTVFELEKSKGDRFQLLLQMKSVSMVKFMDSDATYFMLLNSGEGGEALAHLVERHNHF